MTQKKGTCLRRSLIGCAGCAGLFVLFGLIMAVVGLSTRSVPAEYEASELVDSVAQMIEPSQRMAGGDVAGAKPIRVKMRVQMANMRVRPGDDSGQIRVESDYDKANFELTTEAIDKGDRVEYELRFRNKRTILGMLMSEGGIDDNDIQNDLTLYLPRDLLVSLDYEFEMGQLDMDLSGLAIAELEGDFTMGRFDVRMREPNQTEIERVRMDSSLGDVRINDAQNLRFAKAELEHSMGDFRVYHSGPYQKDADIRVDMTMGSARIYQPPDTNLDQSMIAMLGESRPARVDPPDPDLPTLTVRGKVTMGDIRTSQDNNRSEMSRLIKTVTGGDIEAAITEYRERIEVSPRRALTRGQLNQTGYDLLRIQEVEAAIAVFELNISLHPDYVNGFDSLGDGYRSAGRLQDAAVVYRQALEMAAGSGSQVTRRKLERVEARLAENEPNEIN